MDSTFEANSEKPDRHSNITFRKQRSTMLSSACNVKRLMGNSSGLENEAEHEADEEELVAMDCTIDESEAEEPMASEFTITRHNDNNDNNDNVKSVKVHVDNAEILWINLSAHHNQATTRSQVSPIAGPSSKYVHLLSINRTVMLICFVFTLQGRELHSPGYSKSEFLSQTQASSPVDHGYATQTQIEVTQQEKEKILPHSRKTITSRTGVTFPVRRLARRLKAGTNMKTWLSSAVYLSAVIDYMVSEVLDLASYVVSSRNRVRIQPRDINFVLKSDRELYQFTKNAVIPGVPKVAPEVKKM